MKLSLWYVSFVRDEVFVGATVVAAREAKDVLREATARGVNPGGEAAVIQVPESEEQHHDVLVLLNRLANKEEMTAQGAVRLGDMPENVAELVHEHTHVVCEECNEGRA